MVVEHSKYDGTNTTDWEKKLSSRTSRMGSSVIRELLKFTMLPEVISFAGGLPAPESFPVRDFEEACRWVLAKEARSALQYGTTEGYPPLKEVLTETMRKYDVPAVKDNILLTNGSQQALDFIGRVFLDEGDKVIVGSPTYLGALQAWKAYGTQFITVPLDENGMRMDKLEEALSEHPDVKFIYILPNFHNPAGTTLPLERRYKVVELAAKYNVFIVEDDPYGELRYEAEDITPIVALHKENVIYLSTFSKTLAPGIRLGWIVAPERMIKRFVHAKQATDLHTGTFVQYLAHDICSRGLLRAHIKKIREIYKERRDTMLEAMEKHFPKEAKWTHPQGGLFLWVQLPEYIDTEEMLEEAVEEKVAFVPGFAFFANGGGRNCFRLNFSNSTPEDIKIGIERLAKVIKKRIK